MGNPERTWHSNATGTLTRLAYPRRRAGGVDPKVLSIRSGTQTLRLGRLELGPKTEICLGLVHNTDGIEGTMTRLRTARKHTESFAIAMECGFARRDPATIPELLRIHREIALKISFERE